jgi:nucleoside-diphosphate-sugar epimerase
MKRKILVTGATGFIGSWLVRKLIEQGESVSIIVRNKKLNSRLSNISHKLHVYECDLQDPGLEKVVDTIKPNIVFHLAAYGALPGQKVTIQELIDTNVNGLINLINVTKKHKLQLFVNTGSSSEYGVKNNSMNEFDILLPINDYGVSKAAATLYAQKIALTELLPIVTLRLFSPFGYQDDVNRLIPFVIAKALVNEPIALSSQQNVRDFIYIEDVVSAYLAILEKKVAPGEIINIGSGQQHSVYAIVRQIIRITKSKSKLEWNTMPKQSRQIEPKKWHADIQKAKKLLQWSPKYTLQQGLEKTIEQYKNQKYD